MSIFCLLYCLTFFFYVITNVSTVPNSNIEVDVYDITEGPIIEEAIEVVVVEEIPIQRVSAYNPVPRQTWGDPNVSSCGPNQARQIAVSRDLFFDENGEKHLCGTLVTIITYRGEVFENYVIWDTMHPRFENTVDIMIPNTNEAEAFAFGITTGVMIIHD